MIVAAGIDVGGRKKGFHGVVLGDGGYLDKLHCTDPAEMAAWVRSTGARATAVDAPCRWRKGAEPRAAERELARMGIRCFATPVQAAAAAHPFYEWMRNGMSLYAALDPHYPLFHRCFETFPQAVACILAGRLLPARNKRLDRPGLLQEAHIDSSLLPGQDFIDAALCALSAHRCLLGKFQKLGDEAGGYLILPASPRRRLA